MEYTQTELRILAVCSAIGGVFSFLVVGLDLPINSLLALICFDYFTGMLAAWRTSALSSKTGFDGIKRKLFILVVVCLSNLLDNSVSLEHSFRNMIIFGYGAMEGLSIFENFDRIGWGEYIPKILRDKLIQIRDEKGMKS